MKKIVAIAGISLAILFASVSYAAPLDDAKQRLRIAVTGSENPPAQGGAARLSNAGQNILTQSIAQQKAGSP